MIYLNLRSVMKEIQSAGIEFHNPIVTIEEAKASRVNAVLKGTIQKDNHQEIQYQYIRIDFLSEQNKVLNSRYISVSDLKENEKLEFTIKTNTENVKKYKFTLTDTKEVSETNIKFQEVEALIAGVLLIWALL